MRRRKHWWVGLLAVALLVAAAVVIAILVEREPPESAPLDPNPSSSFRIVALGDSYISGEGTRRYYRGTDQPGRNMCHRAARAYPHLLAEQLKASLVFVACAGAETTDVIAREQYPRSGEEDYGEVYGARPQLEVLEEVEDPDVVLISIGGNDAGFRKIVTECLTDPSCDASSASWLGQLDSRVRPALERTYPLVKEAADGAPVFAMTYPSPLRPLYCNDLFGVDREEWRFLNAFIRELDETVRSAAAVAGVEVIDLDGALVDHRFCEEKPQEAAINFVRVRIGSGDRVIHLGDFQESLHPNVEGHRLLEEAVLPRLQALQAEAEAGA
jgi:lysophospholipase L1-like esterase